MAECTLAYDFVNKPSLEAVVGPTLSITRATEARVLGHDGFIHTIPAGYARFTGARQIVNHFDISEPLYTECSVRSNGENGTMDGFASAIHQPATPGTASWAYAPGGATPTLGEGEYWVVSAYIEMDDGSEPQLGFNSESGDFGLFIGGSLCTQGGVEHVRDNIYRAWGTKNAPTSYTNPGNNGVGVYATMSNKQLTCSGYMLEKRSQATNKWGPSDYIRTTGSPVAAANYAETLYGFNENLLALSSNLALSATWPNGNGSVDRTQGETDPQGGATAWTLTDNLSPGFEYFLQTVTGLFNGVTLTGSFYIKKDSTPASTRFPLIRLQRYSGGTQGNHDFRIDTSTGEFKCSVTSGSGSVTGRVTSKGDYWFCEIISTDGSTNTACQVQVYPAVGANSNLTTYSANATGSIVLWGPQLQHDPNSEGATDYLPTGSSSRTGVWSPGGRVAVERKGLLVESSSTNLCLQSEDFTNASWVKDTQGVITGDYALAPDGSMTADQWADDGGGGGATLNVYQATSLTGSTTYVFSVFVKADGLSDVFMQPQGIVVPGPASYFDVINGEVTSSVGTDDSGIDDYGNGWYRCWYSWTSDATDTAATWHIYLADTDTTVDRDGTSSLILWGAQLEVGSFPTSYIPTTTTTVTRNLEEVKSTDVTWYNSKGSCLYLNAAAIGEPSIAQILWDISDGTTSNRHTLYFNSQDTGAYTSTGGGVLPGDGSATRDNFVRMVSSHSPGAAGQDLSLAYDGNLGSPDLTATEVTGLTQFNIGTRYDSSANQPGEAHYKEVMYWPEARFGDDADLSDGTIDVLVGTGESVVTREEWFRRRRQHKRVRIRKIRRAR